MSQRHRAQKRKKCPFHAEGMQEVDYKQVEILRGFITVGGKILPRRVTGVSAKMQRKLSLAIRRARYVGLLPFLDKNVTQG
jgi:small subunit ribosomal protein S18